MQGWCNSKEKREIHLETELNHLKVEVRRKTKKIRRKARIRKDIMMTMMKSIRYLQIIWKKKAWYTIRLLSTKTTSPWDLMKVLQVTSRRRRQIIILDRWLNQQNTQVLLWQLDHSLISNLKVMKKEIRDTTQIHLTMTWRTLWENMKEVSMLELTIKARSILATMVYQPTKMISTTRTRVHTTVYKQALVRLSRHQRTAKWIDQLTCIPMIMKIHQFLSQKALE